MSKNITKSAFTLIELLLCLAIIGVIMLLVVPSSSELFAKNRTLAFVNTLQSALRFTRYQAILRREEVRFCGSRNQVTCDGWWQDGQIIIAKSGKVLRGYPKVFAGYKLWWRSSGGLNSWLEFTPIGFTKQHGSFFYCPKNYPKNAKAVRIIPTGRAIIGDLKSDEDCGKRV